MLPSLRRPPYWQDGYPAEKASLVLSDILTSGLMMSRGCCLPGSHSFKHVGFFKVAAGVYWLVLKEAEVLKGSPQNIATLQSY